MNLPLHRNVQKPATGYQVPYGAMLPYGSRYDMVDIDHMVAGTRKILIISPDPESRRMLELAFELDGFETRSAVDDRGPLTAGGADAILIDMVEDSKDEWSAVRLALLRSKRTSRRRTPKTAIVLPRGYGGSKPPKGVLIPDAIFRKPYELLNMIRQVGQLAASPGSGEQRKRTGARKMRIARAIP